MTNDRVICYNIIFKAFFKHPFAFMEGHKAPLNLSHTFLRIIQLCYKGIHGLHVLIKQPVNYKQIKNYVSHNL